MITCPNCGKTVEETRFCPECGCSLPSAETEIKIRTNETSERIAKKKSKRNPVLTIILIIALVAGLAGGVLLLFGDKIFPESYEDIQKEESNISSKSCAEILTTDYWIIDTNYYEFDGGTDALLFREVENNSTFDGIIMMTTEYVLPYIIDEDGTITVFGFSYNLNYSTDSYDWEYTPAFEITIGENENGSNYLMLNVDGDIIRYNKADESLSNDMMVSLLFSDWSDYYCKPDSFDEYDDHGFRRWTTNEAQRDVSFFTFSYKIKDGCNAEQAYYEYGDEEAVFSCSWYESLSCNIDIDEKCVYIDDVRFDFNDDFTQLYNAEENLALYRVTDFLLGKIADTDFPSGKLVE